MGAAEDEFGRNVRRERERRGWSQAKVSEELALGGVELHPSAIQKIEDRDVARPRAIRLDEARALAAIFGRSLDDMFVPANPGVEAVLDAARWLMDLAGGETYGHGRRVDRQLEDAAARRYGDDEHELKEAVDSALSLVGDMRRRHEDAAEAARVLALKVRKLRAGGG